MIELQSVFQGLATGVVIIDDRQRISYMNRSAENLLMLDLFSVLGKPCHQVLRTTACEKNCVFAKTLEMKTSQFIGMDCFYKNSVNQSLRLHVASSPVFDRSGDLSYVALFINPIPAPPLAADTAPTFQIGEFRSCSPAMEKIFHYFMKMADVDTTVLLTGETGTGKEVLARTLHDVGPRREKPFVALNCGAFPEQLLESELFGYKAGAFTGANHDKPGRFALADGGTLFLDEIGEISMPMQVRLLRALQERTYEPLGSVKSETTDIRVIAATNRNLADMVREGTFRSDLYYRINVLHIEIPPLRQRPEDILFLSEHLIRRLNHSMGRNISGLSKRAIQLFLNYDWPGNVRELENVLEQSMVFCSGPLIEPEHLPATLLHEENKREEENPVTLNMTQVLKNTEAQAIEAALEQCHGNKRKAAELLGIPPSSLYRKLKNLF